MHVRSMNTIAIAKTQLLPIMHYIPLMVEFRSAFADIYPVQYDASQFMMRR